MRSRVTRQIIGDATSASRNPRKRIEHIFADFRAGLVAAAAVLAFETLTAGVAVVVCVVVYFVTPWEGSS
jgi:hypothetical protein